MNPLRIGISIGDVNGIGPEVVIKALGRRGILELITPVIYASPAVIAYYAGEQGMHYERIENASDARDGHVNLVDCLPADLEITPGKPTEAGGRAAALSLERAVADADAGKVDALVTAPINKSVMPKDDFPFPGHTEMLTERLGADESLMFLVTEGLRVGLVTNHLPVSEVAGKVTKEAILKKLRIMDATLRADFGLEKPLIAVMALNPHAGDEGRIGTEDQKIVRPAVEAAKEEGLMALGPYPADGFFGSGSPAKFDGILAMYHDQGLVPFKALSFGSGVNFTGGLSIVRTSPDHGTAYDIAGKDKASPESFLSALFLARTAYHNRARFIEDSANPLGSYHHLVYKKRKNSRKGRN